MDEKDYKAHQARIKKIERETKAALKPKAPKPFKITLRSRRLWVIKGYTATEGHADEAFGEVLNGQLYTSEVLACHAAELLAARCHQKIYRNGNQPTEDELQEQNQWLGIDSLLINTDGL